MLCTIVKPEQNCTFATKKGGCGFGREDETCRPVVDRCEGCEHIQEWPKGRFCLYFPDPGAKWAVGLCNMATHEKYEEKTEDRKINPLKASKKKAAGR